MAGIVWLYNFYFLLLVAVILFWLKKGIPPLVSQLSVAYAIILIVTESFLFARPPGRMWHSPLFVTHFLTSALVAGAGALILAAAVLWKRDGKEKQLNALAKIALPLVVLNLVAETAEIFSHGAIAHMESVFALLAISLALLFLWSAKPKLITIAGLITLLSTFAVKYTLLISAQTVAPYRGFEEAYIEPKLAFGYFPTLPEVSIAIGLVVLTAGTFYILYKLFPLTREA